MFKVLCLCFTLSFAQINFDRFNAEIAREQDPSNNPETDTTSKEKQIKCTTNDQGPQKNVPCVFPFILNGRTYRRCTRDYDVNHKLWCSTKVDSDLQHIPKEKNWGYCSEECQILNQKVQSASTTTTTQQPLTTRPTKIQAITFRPSQFQPPILIPNEEDQYTNKFQSTSEDQGYCGIDHSSGFLIGGVEAKRGAYPFVVAISYRGQNNEISFGCGGTLISRRYVLTAAHCHHATDPRLQIAEVTVGEHDLRNDPDCIGCRLAQRFQISPHDVTIHEDYNSARTITDGNDIALVRLPRDAITAQQDADENVLPVCLPTSSQDVFFASEYIVLGWGRTTNDLNEIRQGGSKSDILQQLKVPILDTSDCKQKYPSYSVIDENKQFCAGAEEGKDSCNGDSGGPLIAIHEVNRQKIMYLYGIVSFGTSKCGAGYPGVYTNVVYYLDWIKSHMKP